MPDHEAALLLAFDLVAETGRSLGGLGLVAVGHRVVHGGPNLYRPTVVDDALLDELRGWRRWHHCTIRPRCWASGGPQTAS